MITLAVLVCFLLSLTIPKPAEAAQTVPYKLNFQGRLTDSTGTAKADGNYNMKFRIFSVSSGGTANWTETWDASTSQVTVSGGLFTVQLGTHSALSPNDFTSYPLYVEVELPTPATAICDTVACASWTEGAMTPRKAVGSAPYAMNADTVDGIDGANLAQLNQNNSFTGTMTLTSDSAVAVDIRNTSNTSLLVADTTNTVVKIGNPSAATLSNVRLLTTNAEFSGTVRIGDATNGVEFSGTSLLFRGTARPTKQITISPEYPGATFTGDGTSNNGSLSSDFCSAAARLSVNTADCPVGTANEHNYYEWTTTQGTAQDYDIYVRYQMPSDYDNSDTANILSAINMWGFRSTVSDSVTLELFNASGGQCGATLTVSSTNATWTENAMTGVSSADTDCTAIAAGDTVTFRIKVTATNTNFARAGAIRFSYKAKF